MTGPRCTVCHRPIHMALAVGDRWVWVHDTQPPPSPHRATHEATPHVLP